MLSANGGASSPTSGAAEESACPVPLDVIPAEDGKNDDYLAADDSQLGSDCPDRDDGRRTHGQISDCGLYNDGCYKAPARERAALTRTFLVRAVFPILFDIFNFCI